MRILLAVLCIGVPWTAAATKVPKDGEPAPAESGEDEAAVMVKTGCDFKVGDERTYELKWSTESVYNINDPHNPVERMSTQSGWAVRAHVQVTASGDESMDVIARFSSFDQGDTPSDEVVMDRAILSAKQPVTFTYERASSAVHLLDSEAYLAETQAIYLAWMVERVGSSVPPEDLLPEGWNDIVPALLTARLIHIFVGSCTEVRLGETVMGGEFDAGSTYKGEVPTAFPAKTTTTVRYEQQPDQSIVFATLVKTEMGLDGEVPSGQGSSLKSDTLFTSTVMPSGWSAGWTQTSTTQHPIMKVDWESTGVLITEP